MKRISFEELRNLGFDNKFKKAAIVFDEKSFNQFYPLESRTYIFSVDNKIFNRNAAGFSLFADSLDGSDMYVNLVNYMYYHQNPKDNWKVEYCYIID